MSHTEKDKKMVYKKKICMIGAPAVGKTSLVRRFVHNIFDDKYLTTIGVNISQKLCSPVQTPGTQSVQYTFLVWDIEGTEDLGPKVKNYYLGASGALIVTDLSRKETVDVIPELVEGLRDVSPKVEIILVGNKLDLVKMDEKTIEDLAKITGSSGFHSFPTSAKSGQNVEAAFLKFAELFSLEIK